MTVKRLIKNGFIADGSGTPGYKADVLLNDGIIEKDIEKTIRNLGSIGSVGMKQTDTMILDIMVCK